MVYHNDVPQCALVCHGVPQLWCALVCHGVPCVQWCRIYDEIQINDWLIELNARVLWILMIVYTCTPLHTKAHQGTPWHTKAHHGRVCLKVVAHQGTPWQKVPQSCGTPWHTKAHHGKVCLKVVAHHGTPRHTVVHLCGTPWNKCATTLWHTSVPWHTGVPNSTSAPWYHLKVNIPLILNFILDF